LRFQFRHRHQFVGAAQDIFDPVAAMSALRQ
jgi:hypothetical protein